MKLLILFATSALMTLSVPAIAAGNGQTFRAIVSGEQVNLRPDKAYLLVRSLADEKGRSGLPLLLRVPTKQENQQFHDAKLAEWRKKGAKAGPFESYPFALRGLGNLYIPDIKKPLERDATVNAYLFETEPGDYVVYGVGNKYSLMMCLCLGSVGFSAKPGHVTDVGTFLFGRASQPSPHTELAEVTNLGLAFDMDFPLISVALRPHRSIDLVPSAVQQMTRVDAKLYAVGPYYEASTRGVNRLAPIPGVLGYQRGAPVDVASGKPAPSGLLP